MHLASMETPFQTPLTANLPENTPWWIPISLPVHVHLSHNVSAWLRFAREGWRSGYITVQAAVSRAKIQGGPL